MHHRIDTFQAGDTFAQWPGGHEPTVAEAEIGSDDGDFCIAGERVVLQAVVGENEAGGGVIMQQLRRRLRAFAGDGNLLISEKDAVKTAAWPEALKARTYVVDYRALLPPELLPALRRKLGV